MSKGLSVYPTTKTGADSPDNVTGTSCGTDKFGLDVTVCNDTAIEVDGNFTPSGLTVGGLVTVVPLNSVTWTALPASALAARNGMGIQNETAIEIKVNFSAAVVGYVGWTVKPSGEFFIDVSDSIIVYAKSASGTPSVTIMEVA